MGCRTHLRLAWSMQTTCKGLGKPQSKSARLPAIGVHPPHAEKAMQSNVMFPDRLSATDKYLLRFKEKAGVFLASEFRNSSNLRSTCKPTILTFPTRTPLGSR